MGTVPAGKDKVSTEGNSGCRRWIISIALAALTVTVFWKVFELPFISYDDPDYVTENSSVRKGLTLESAAWAIRSVQAANWFPVTWLSHMLDVSLFGLDPFGHHAMNLALHACNVVLLFLLFSRLTGEVWRSAFAAAFFAVHPLRVESVAWVAERKDVLCACFWLLTMHSYCSWVRNGKRSAYLAAVGFFALGLASKPMAVTLPFALLLLDAWPLGRLKPANLTHSGVWPLAREKAPFFAMSLASSAITFFAQHAGGAVKPLETISMGARTANAAVAAVSYIGKILWPASLSVFYPFPETPPSPVVVAGCVLLLGALTSVALWAWRDRPFVPVGWFWFIGTLVPVIGIVQVGLQAMADRYTYIPGIGLGLIVAWIVPYPKLRTPIRAWAIPLAAATWLFALGILTTRQLDYWRGDYPLFRHALDLDDRNWLAELVIGTTLEKHGAVDQAIARYRRALEIRPQSEQAHNNLGNALLNQGRTAEGLMHLREAVRLYPGYVTALSNLGGTLCEMGQYEEGLSYLREATRQAPEHVPARFNYGLALSAAGRREDAMRQFEEVLRLDPNDQEARLQLELLRLRRGTGIDRGTR
jgi:Tfp pilus assembly protein PilF